MQLPRLNNESAHGQPDSRRLLRRTGAQIKTVWLLCAGLLLAGGTGLAWFAQAATDTSAQTQGAEEISAVKQQGPVIPKGKGDQCVADTALMRTDHMDLLNHQRDETVIDGIRGNPFSLVDCVNCHAQTTADGTPVRIDAEGQFCQSCHAYAAVKIDCFTCHAALPETESESAAAGHFDADRFDHSQLSVLATADINRSFFNTSGFIVSGSKDEHSTRD